jgi:hypothetical protein
MRTPPGKFLTDLRETIAGEQASPRMRQAAGQLSDALRTGDAAAAAKLFSYDAVYVDQGLRLHIEGRYAIARYLERAITSVPYGKGSALRHVVGGRQGRRLRMDCRPRGIGWSWDNCLSIGPNV